MKITRGALLLSFFLVASVNAVLAQNGELTIRFISNCGLLISDGTTHIYSDFPYRSGAFIYDEFDDAELENIKDSAIFIFTHKHGDHYSRKNMKAVMKNKNGRKYGKWNLDELEQLAETIPDFEIQAFKNKHRFSFAHYSYLITWHGKKIFLSGDAEKIETIEKMTDLDWAFVPGWLLMTAHRSGFKIDTKMIAIYHIGRGDVIEVDSPKVLVLDKQGEVITIPY